MPRLIESRPIAPIAGIDLALAKRNLAEVQRALSAINYSDVWKHVGKLIRCGNVTVDAHKHGHGRDVCVKMHVGDGDSARRIVADVRIDDGLRRYTVEDDPEMKKWIAQVVKGAIVKSLNSGLQYKVDDAIMP